MEITTLWLVAENDQDEREYLSLRSLLSLPTEDFYLLSRGVEINPFLKTHHFCGKCGQKAEQTHDELAVQCTSCGYRTYPVICPLRLLSPFAVAQEILLANQTPLHARQSGYLHHASRFCRSG